MSEIEAVFSFFLRLKEDLISILILINTIQNVNNISVLFKDIYSFFFFKKKTVIFLDKGDKLKLKNFKINLKLINILQSIVAIEKTNMPFTCYLGRVWTFHV